VYDWSRLRYGTTPQRTTRTTANVCDVNGLILSWKRVNQTLQTMRQQYLKLCTAANIPEPVNDVLQMKQHLIAVWSGVQQTVVDEAIDEQKKFLGLQMDTRLRICYNVWSSTFSVYILPLSCWNFCVCRVCFAELLWCASQCSRCQWKNLSWFSVLLRIAK